MSPSQEGARVKVFRSIMIYLSALIMCLLTCENLNLPASVCLLCYHVHLPAYLSSILVHLPCLLDSAAEVPAYLPTYLPACLPACLPAYLPTYLPTYLPICTCLRVRNRKLCALGSCPLL